MKTTLKRTKPTRALLIAMCAAGCAALAQQPAAGPGQGGQGGQGGGDRHPPLPPVIQALDTNGDGIIEADEIANAAASLKKLLKNGADSLTIADLLGHPPRGRRQGGGPGQQGGPGGGGRQFDMNGGQGGPQGQPGPDGPPQDDQRQARSQAGPPQDAPPEEGMRHHGPPLCPLFEALDTNHDGVLSAGEIANSAAILQKLEKPGANQITKEDLRPAGPPPPPPGDEPRQPQDPPAQAGASAANPLPRQP